jgi:hypothetical protein
MSDTKNERLDELKAELKESCQSTIRILQSIIEDIDDGTYTIEKAEMDYENMMWNDGINFMSCVGDIANYED